MHSYIKIRHIHTNFYPIYFEIHLRFILRFINLSSTIFPQGLYIGQTKDCTNVWYYICAMNSWIADSSNTVFFVVLSSYWTSLYRVFKVLQYKLATHFFFFYGLNFCSTTVTFFLEVIFHSKAFFLYYIKYSFAWLKKFPLLHLIIADTIFL